MSSGGYYSIDSILTDAQKIPCTFTLTVPQLGHLTSDPNHPLEAGTQVHPFHFHSVLFSHDNPFASARLVAQPYIRAHMPTPLTRTAGFPSNMACNAPSPLPVPLHVRRTGHTGPTPGSERAGHECAQG
jgi:hypothetical protein